MKENSETFVKVTKKYNITQANGRKEISERIIGYFLPPANQVLKYMGSRVPIVRYKSIVFPLGDWGLKGDEGRQVIVPPTLGISIDECCCENLPLGILSLRNPDKTDEYIICNGINSGSNGENDNFHEWLKRFGVVIAYNLELNEEMRIKTGLQNYLDLPKESLSDQDNTARICSKIAFPYLQKEDQLLEIARILGFDNPNRQDLTKILNKQRDFNLSILKKSIDSVALK